MGGGSDMTNVKNSNLKVPPLKIVLSSATSGGSDRSSSTSPSSESESLDSDLTIISENQQQHERNSRQTDLSNSGSSSGHSNKDDANLGVKFDRAPRQHVVRGLAGNDEDQKGSAADPKAASTTTSSGTGSNSVSRNQTNNINGTKRMQDNTLNCDQTATRELSNSSSSSSNQRITRSSQRAAQQNKPDNPMETTGDDTNPTENQERSASESGQRKVKRRKNLLIEMMEETHNQQVAQPEPNLMPNICPADYQLPSQNAFELYRDISNRPYIQMMQLNFVQPKVPHGFKNYFLCNGPYLLDGNKVGVGINGSKTLESYQARCSQSQASNLFPKEAHLAASLRLKSSSTNQPSELHKRHGSYNVPRLVQAPKHLEQGTLLFELYQDQERARQRLRLQHLKERERSVLSAEQEILRAYNRVAIADNRQKSHLSACTYFYHQERYHYIDEKSNYLDSINQKDSSQSRENSDSCNAENVSTSSSANRSQGTEDRTSNGFVASDTYNVEKLVSHDGIKQEDGLPSGNIGSTAEQQSTTTNKRRKVDPENDEKLEATPTPVNNDSKNVIDTILDKTVKSYNNESSSGGQGPKGETAMVTNKSDDETNSYTSSLTKARENGSDVDVRGLEAKSAHVSDSDLKQLNKTTFINNLQDIDDTWTKIREEMHIRHKNESDSLYAVQSLEWEWKAKEIGICDIRLSLRVDSEFVPRVEVCPMDY